MLRTLRDRIVDGFDPTSLAGRARARRYAMLYARFPELPDMRVLDLGGVPAFWATVPVAPKHVTLLNVQACGSDRDWIETRVGDACDPPADLLHGGFDLAFSNSVIEHVGGHARRQRFADTVRLAAPSYWVQTPYKYFPVEPHWLFPGAQFLPTSARAWLTRHWEPSRIRCTDPAAAVASSLEVELVDVTAMRHYFPDARICRERFGGLTKSLIAVR